MRRLAWIALIAPMLAACAAERPRQARRPELPAPTHANVAYGPHARNVLDFWRADTPDPAPLIVYIHGGGFVGGSKDTVSPAHVRQALDAGVSFAAINYRYRTPEVPLYLVLRDSARAIQFVRGQAEAWHLDKSRVAAYGGSAGAGTSLWLAAHDDLADPNSEDPVLRESTRLTVAGINNGQFSYDLRRWKEAFDQPLERFGGTADLPSFYGAAIRTEADLERPEVARWRADLDLIGLLSADDPPLYLFCGNPDDPPTDRGELVHHPKHEQLLKARCDELGIEAVLDLPRVQSREERAGVPGVMAFLIEKLGSQPTAKTGGAPIR